MKKYCSYNNKKLKDTMNKKINKRKANRSSGDKKRTFKKTLLKISITNLGGDLEVIFRDIEGYTGIYREV